MTPYIDIHAHLDFPGIDLKRCIDNARKNNVEIISNGTDYLSNVKTLQLANDHNIMPALGFYPFDANPNQIKGVKAEEKKIISQIYENKELIKALGEVGLDYHHGAKNESDKNIQKMIFKKMISLSKEIGKPLIIHSRKAELDVIELLEEENIKPCLVIMHCFSGKKSLLKRAIANRWYFTVPSNVTRSKSFQWMAKEIDLNHLFCETDSPFLSPFPDSENEPVNVIESYKMIAKLKGLDLKEVRNNIYMNFQNIFL